MAYKMGDLRNLQNNLYYFVASGLENYGYNILSSYEEAYIPTGVYLLGEEPRKIEEIKIPAIVLVFSREDEDPLEIGTLGGVQTLSMSLEVLARNNGERDDLSSLLKFLLKKRTMDIYDLNAYFDTGEYIKIGCADFSSIVINSVGNNTTLRTLDHRARVGFNCEYITDGLSLIDYEY